MILTYRIIKNVANGFSSRPEGMNGRFTTGNRARVAIYRENLFQINILPGDIYQICPLEYSKSIRERINSMIPFKITKVPGHSGWLFPNDIAFCDTMKINKDGTPFVPQNDSVPPKLAKIINGDDEERIVKPKKKATAKEAFIPPPVPVAMTNTRHVPVPPITFQDIEAARQQNVLNNYLQSSGTVIPADIAIEPPNRFVSSVLDIDNIF